MRDRVGTRPLPVGLHRHCGLSLSDQDAFANILVGVGQSKAEAIVAYREENGRFKSLEDLARVRGIGEATIKRNEARISLGDKER